MDASTMYGIALFATIFLIPALFIGLIILVVYIGIKKSRNFPRPQNTPNPNQNVHQDTPPRVVMPYTLRQKVLTPKEQSFYKSLKPIADELHLTIVCKMRIADIVYVPNNTHNFNFWFNKIKAKHLDFLLVNNAFQPRLAIEVDDKTHDTRSAQERDNMVDAIYDYVGLKILHIRVWDNEELKYIINESLGFHREPEIDCPLTSAEPTEL